MAFFVVFRATRPTGLVAIRNRLVNNGLMFQDPETSEYLTAEGVHYVLLAPEIITPGTYDPETGAEITPPVLDTLWRVYLYISGLKEQDEDDYDSANWGGVIDDAPSAYLTKLGRYFRNNGTWDETRKGWQIGNEVWLCREDQLVPDLKIQGINQRFGW